MRTEERSDTRYVRVTHWNDAEVRLTSQNIQQASTWNIARDGHTIVIHLSGPIRRTETEVNGAGIEVGPGGPGEILLVPAEYRYACQAQGGVVSFAGVRLGSRFFQHTWRIPDETVELQLRLFQRDTFVYETIKRLATLVGQDDDVSQMTARHLIHALSGHLLQTYRTRKDSGDAAQPHSTLTPRAIRHLQQYVQDHLAERIDVDTLACVAGVDVRGVFSAFRHEFQTTPAQYVIEQRIRRARWLLTNTGHDITTIAMLTGFASHSHLTTAFKKHTGLTPHAFRTETQ